MRTGLKCINCIALDADTNKIVYVTETVKGQKFICPECKKKMVLCAEDSKQVSPYFKHASKTTCFGGTCESLVHRLCKEVISNLPEFTLPEVRVNVMNDSLVVDNTRLFKVLDCDIEKSLKNSDTLIKPDAILRVDSDTVDSIIVEFKNTHSSSNIKKSFLRKLNRVVAIEISIKALAKLGYFPDRQEIINHIQCGCNIHYLYHEKLEEVVRKYKDSIFKVNSEKYLCPLTDYTVTVDRTKCKKCACYLEREGDGVVCTGKGCYTKPKQLLNNTTLEERCDLYVDIPENKNKEFRLVNKRCEHCGDYLRLGVGVRGNTMNGLLVRVPADTNYLYYVCVNDTCNKSYSAPLKCKNTEKIVPKYRCDTTGEPILNEENRPIFVTVNGKIQYTTCGGYARSLTKSTKGAEHDFGARFIGCSATEKDTDLLPIGQLKSCDASVTLFDNEADFKSGVWSEEILAIGGIDMFFDDYNKAKKIITKIRNKKK